MTGPHISNLEVISWEISGVAELRKLSDRRIIRPILALSDPRRIVDFGQISADLWRILNRRKWAENGQELSKIWAKFE